MCSWYDFAEAIFRLSGYDTQLHPIRSSEYPTRAERPHYSVLDKARVREAFGITIPHWRTALEECLQLTASLPRIILFTTHLCTITAPYSSPAALASSARMSSDFWPISIHSTHRLPG